MFEGPIYLYFWLFFGIIILIIILYALSGNRKHVKLGVYAPRHSNEHMELDLRLPYKRFKQLYPYSKITYQEYKKLQMKGAFRRAVSSEKNKRMVR